MYQNFTAIQQRKCKNNCKNKAQRNFVYICLSDFQIFLPLLCCLLFLAIIFLLFLYLGIATKAPPVYFPEHIFCLG